MGQEEDRTRQNLLPCSRKGALERMPQGGPISSSPYLRTDGGTDPTLIAPASLELKRTKTISLSNLWPEMLKELQLLWSAQSRSSTIGSHFIVRNHHRGRITESWSSHVWLPLQSFSALLLLLFVLSREITLQAALGGTCFLTA